MTSRSSERSSKVAGPGSGPAGYLVEPGEVRDWITAHGGRPLVLPASAGATPRCSVVFDAPPGAPPGDVDETTWATFLAAMRADELALYFTEPAADDGVASCTFHRRPASARAASEPGSVAGRRAPPRAAAHRRAPTPASALPGKAHSGGLSSRGAGLRAAACMTPDPAFGLPQTTLVQIARAMKDRDCGAIPIVDHARSRIPIGIVTDRDIAVRAVARGLDPRHTPALRCMSSPVLTVSPSDDVEDIIHMLEQAQLRRAVVVDGEGRLIGMLAQADLVLQMPRLGQELLECVSAPRFDVLGLEPPGHAQA